MPTTETKFILLSYRICILFFTFLLLLLFIIILFLFVFLLFSFLCFVWFHCLTGSLFSLSYCILVSLPLFHLYSKNTLLFIFCSLFFTFRSYISCYITVVPSPTSILPWCWSTSLSSWALLLLWLTWFSCTLCQVSTHYYQYIPSFKVP